MKNISPVCLLLLFALLLCACSDTSGEIGVSGESGGTSYVSGGPVTETQPIRYTYASEASVYGMSDLYRAFDYIGGNTVVCSPSWSDDMSDPIMVLYDLATGEFKQQYVPKDQTEHLCRYYLGVRENGEFGMSSAFGECLWFDRDGIFLELDLWFDGDDLSAAYHDLIGVRETFFDNGDNLICYYDSEKSIPDNKKGYYMLFDRTTCEKTEFLVWDDKINDNYENYRVLGFAGKNHILYEKCVSDEYGDSYSLHLRDLTTGQETSVESDESYGEIMHLQETEKGCSFVMCDRRWLKKMELSTDGALEQAADSYTAYADGENHELYYDRTTQTIAVATQDFAPQGVTVTLVDANTLEPYAEIDVPLESGFYVQKLRVCHDGTVQMLADNMKKTMLILWRVV